MTIDIENAAREKFGDPNTALSTNKELRFGQHGSKTVDKKSGAWFDFEDEEGGWLVDQRKEKEELQAAYRSYRLIVDKYDYVDAKGNFLFQVVRYAGHDFSQRRPDGKGGWIWGLKNSGLPMVLYNLPSVIKAEEIVVVAGEKDCLNVTKKTGMVATTNVGGEARKWEEENTQYFKDKDVYIVPDNDERGIKHANEVAEALFGTAKSVRICNICAGMENKADSSDWLEVNEGYREALLKFPAIEETEGLIEVYETIDADDMVEAVSGDDFVENLLINGQMSVLYGPSNSGKTFFATDLSLHVALGWNWRGLEVDQGSVLYLAMEGSYGIRNRVVAFRDHYNVAEKIPFSVVPVAINFLNDDIEKLINTVRMASRRLGNVKMVVVDTLSRALAGGDENGPKDMTAFVGAVDRLREAVSAHVLIVHHTGKDEAKGARGHSSLRAATDTEIEVVAGDDFSCAKVTKQRELEIVGEYGFSLQGVRIGTNARGKDVTSCVVRVVDEVQIRKKSKPTGKAQKIVLKALWNALAANGMDGAVLGKEYSVGRVVKEEDWRLEAYRLLSGESKHKSTTFNRTVDGLVADEFVCRSNEYCWIVQ